MGFVFFRFEGDYLSSCNLPHSLSNVVDSFLLFDFSVRILIQTIVLWVPVCDELRVSELFRACAILPIRFPTWLMHSCLYVSARILIQPSFLSPSPMNLAYLTTLRFLILPICGSFAWWWLRFDLKLLDWKLGCQPLWCYPWWPVGNWDSHWESLVDDLSDQDNREDCLNLFKVFRLVRFFMLRHTFLQPFWRIGTFLFEYHDDDDDDDFIIGDVQLKFIVQKSIQQSGWSQFCL